VFDRDWHKVNFGVFKDKLILNIDCKFTGNEDLKPRSLIKVDGNISIAKMNNNNITVPVRLPLYQICIRSLIIALNLLFSLTPFDRKFFNKFLFNYLLKADLCVHVHLSNIHELHHCLLRGMRVFQR